MDYRIVNSRRILIVLLLFCFMTTKAQLPDFSKYPVYEGKDLGLTYTPVTSFFRIWAPTAELAELRLYDKGIEGDVLQRVEMTKSAQGTWTASVNRNLIGKF